MCSCQSKMGRRKIGKINFNASSFTPALAITAGFLASQQADKLLDKVPVINTTIGKAIAKVALGAFLSSNKRGLVSNIGTGMIVGAVADTVSGFMTSGGTKEAFRLLRGIRGTGLADESSAMRQTHIMNQPLVKYA